MCRPDRTACSAAVRAAWTELAGGNRNNIREIRWYSQDAVPEDVEKKTVSASGSALPIYSWFADGVICYWSEDPCPHLNEDASYMFAFLAETEYVDVSHMDSSLVTDMEGMFARMAKLKRLILGPANSFNDSTNLSGNWTHEDTGLTLSGKELTTRYSAENAASMAGAWIRNFPEGHYYHSDSSLGQANMWEVHTPADRYADPASLYHYQGKELDAYNELVSPPYEPGVPEEPEKPVTPAKPDKPRKPEAPKPEEPITEEEVVTPEVPKASVPGKKAQDPQGIRPGSVQEDL